jgi:predicted DNA-binding transcriptional regulator
MKRTIKIYKTGHAYLGEEVANQGYNGDVEALFGAVTITLIKPNTILEDVKRSLEITIQDIELRLKQENQ